VDRPSIQFAVCADDDKGEMDRVMAADDLRKGILIGLGFATVQEHMRPAEMFHKLITAWEIEERELTTQELRLEIAMIMHDDVERL
jgi:hypothetical protein